MGLVIFDCDGVLVDSEDISLRTLSEFLGDLGITLDFQEIEDFFKGERLSQIMEQIEQLSGTKLPISFAQDYRTRMESRFETELKPIPGIEKVLRNITHEICLASSGPIAKIEKSLKLTGLTRYFKGRVFSSYEINSWKPEPGIFLHAAKQMGFHPEHCLVVEDSVPGVTAAVRAKMRVLGYAASSNSVDLQNNGAITFSSMEELDRLISVYLN